MEKPKRLLGIIRDIIGVMAIGIVAYIAVVYFNNRLQVKVTKAPLYEDVYVNRIHYLVPVKGGPWVNFTNDSIYFIQKTDTTY